MGNYEDLKQAVEAVIKTNGNEEITGEVLQTVLINLISTFGAKSAFKGIAAPTTNPGTDDANVFYLAGQNGVYQYFNNYSLEGNKIVVFSNKNGTFEATELMEMQETRSYAIVSGQPAREKAFKDVVKNIFVDTNGHGGKYIISYFIKNYLQYGRLGVQIAQADATTVVGTWKIPTDAVLKPGEIYELEPTTSEALVNKGFKVYVEFNDFAEFGTESFLQGTNNELSKVFEFTGVDNPVVNELMKVKKSTQNIGNLGTFVLKPNYEDLLLQWFQSVENIYFYNRNGMVPADKYQINYVWQNSTTWNAADARFGLQLDVDGIVSNYGFPMSTPGADIPKGVLLKMPSRVGEPLTGIVDVYIEFKKDLVFPTNEFFRGLTIPVKPFINNSLLNDEIKILDTFRPLDYEQPTILKAYTNDNQKKWFSVIKNLYIIDPEYLPTDVYTISYFWLNDTANRKFGFQILKNDADPSNYGTNDVLPNTLVNIPHTNTGQPLKKLKVIVEYADFETFPTDIVFTLFNPYKNIFLPAAFDYQKTITIINQTKEDGDIVINDVRLNVETNGANAIQNALDAITDANPKNIYNLRVKSGLYKVTNSSQFLGYPGYPAMILAKDNINIIGDSKPDCVLWAELPYNDADIDTAIGRGQHQTIYNWANNCVIENFTIVGKNIRYVVHQDNPNESNKTRRYKNCDFIFLGDKGNQVAFGIGTFSGSKTYVEGGRSFCASSHPFGCHNNQKFQNPSLWDFKGHTFATVNSETITQMQNSGSLISDILNWEHCKFEGGFILHYNEWYIYTPNYNDHFNHADWKITGFGNEPFYFYNTVNGKGLKVEAATIGQTVRFDKNSSAYDLIISNPHEYFGNLGHPERTIVDKYVVHDNKAGLKSYAIGAKSIQADNYPFGTIASADKLGLRLGDCSTVNKTLTIIIGTTNYDVVFNKNYTAFTNEQVIAEINTVLGAAGVASEYIIGRDYFPELTDVNYKLVNGSATEPILKGTIVKIQNSKILPATTGDIVFGVAIDDIQPYKIEQGIIFGTGRIVRNTILFSGQFLTDTGVSVEKNKKYSAVNGKLVENPDGTLIGHKNGYLLIP